VARRSLLVERALEDAMNWDQVKGDWTRVKGRIRAKWGKLTDNDLETVKGKRDELVGRIQRRYGIAKDRAEREVDELIEKL
jgi:uncharacterized protein YjbJ (UPF0337 family)